VTNPSASSGTYFGRKMPTGSAVLLTRFVCIRTVCFILAVVTAAEAEVLKRGKGLGTYHSASYLSRFVACSTLQILEAAADWHELMILQCIMWPSVSHSSKQLDPRCSA